MTGCKICQTTAARRSGLLSMLIAVLFFGFSLPSYAEEIIYTGKGEVSQGRLSWFSDEASDINLFPGTSAAPLFSGNKVIVNYNPSDPGITNVDVVFGGFSKTEDTSNNTVILRNGLIGKAIFGGYSDDGTVASNIAEVSGGKAFGILIGGFSENGNSIGNKVSLSGGSQSRGIFSGVVCGGASLHYTPDAETRDNAVTVSGGSVESTITGGIGKGRVSRNTVTVSGGAVGYVLGGHGDVHSTTDNTVTIKGGTVSGNVDGGYSDNGEVLKNRVIISGGLIEGFVYGGDSQGGIAVNNIVTISGGSVLGRVYGGSSLGDSATGNSVIISGGSINMSVYGGDGISGAKDNAVTISGGDISGDVLGGFSADEDATGNTVTISGRPNLAKAHIKGGSSSGDKNAFTGNVFNLKGSGISAAGIGNFEYYNFYLPKNLAAEAVMLSVTETVNLAGTTVEIFLQGGGKLRKGDRIALIHSAEGVEYSPENKSCQVKQGGVIYEFSINADNNNLWIEVTEIVGAAQ